MRTSYRAWTLLVALCAGLAVGTSSVAAGEVFAPTDTLRTAPAGRSLRVLDIGVKQDNVAVIWQEQDDEPDFPATDPRLRFRLSTNGGQSFQSQVLIDTRDARDAQADICDDYVWVTNLLRSEGDGPDEWAVVLSGFEINGPGEGGVLLTPAFEDVEAHSPDVACIGNRRHIVAWIEESGATDDLRIDLRSIFEEIGEQPPNYELGPFDADADLGLAVAATGGHAYAAWVRPGAGSDDLRFKRFDIGPGPDSIVTAHPAITLPDALEAGGFPKIAVDGDTIVLAYMQKADLFVRRSTNGGVSFGARERLIDVPFPSEVSAPPDSVDIRGSRAVINATVVGGIFEDVTATQVRLTSNNAGADWSDDEVGTAGNRVGQFSVVGGQTRLVEAWDKYWNEDAQQRLRFHRET